jgi:hypothetical protein
LDTFVKNLKQNQVIQAVLLRNNPGLNSENAMKLYKSVFAKMQVSDDLGNNGLARLNLLGPTVSWMLKSWMRLQCEETRDLISSVTSPQGEHVDNASPFDRTHMSVSTLGSVTAAGAMVSRSPRRQREIEQKILFEEAKEYSVLAYTEPRKFSFSKSDVRSSSAGGHLDETTNEQHEYTVASSSRINDNEWGNDAPVVSSSRDQLAATRNRTSPSSSRRHHQPQPEIESDFSGWADHFEMERPPSRNSVRPRTALAAPMLYSSAEKLPLSSIRNRSNSPLMAGRHSRETQEVYDIKDKDILSNHRYIPRYILSKKSGGGGEEPVVEERVVERRLRSSSADGVRVRGSLTKSQQDVSRAKSPPWRPPSSFHQDPKVVVRVPLAKNVSVFHRGNMAPEPTATRREPPTSTVLRKKKKMKKTTAKTSESPSHGRSKATAKDDMETYRAVSKSVVKATERLEKASAKLLSVAESLSESAMNHSHLSTASANKSRRGSTPARGTNGDDHPSQPHAMDLSHLSHGSDSDIALEELVRARLNFNLRKTLNAALFQEGK